MTGNAEPRLKTPLLRACLAAVAGLCLVTVVRDWFPGNILQVSLDFCFLALAIGGQGALGPLGYDRTSLAVCYGFTVLELVTLVTWGYLGVSDFFVMATVLLAFLSISAVFVTRLRHLFILIGLSAAFLGAHIAWALATGKVDTRQVSLVRQLFIPVLAFLLINLNTVLARLYFNRINREHQDLADERHQRHRSLAQLVRGISHHLNTPLGNAKLILSLPWDDLPDTKDAERLRLIGLSVDRSISLVTRLREFLRNTEETVPRIVDQGSLVLSLTHETGGEVRVEVSEAFLKFEKRQGSLRWDPLGFVLAELVDNARIHSTVPGVVPEVSLDHDGRGCLVVRISSPGTSVTPEVLAKKGLPFFSTLKSPDHPGLGLYFSTYITEHVLGGRLDFIPGGPGGTQVTVTVPTGPDLRAPEPL